MFYKIFSEFHFHNFYVCVDLKEPSSLSTIYSLVFFYYSNIHQYASMLENIIKNEYSTKPQ